MIQSIAFHSVNIITTQVLEDIDILQAILLQALEEQTKKDLDED